MKILIVEDEQDLRETIRTSLLKEKFVVETAADYFSALDKINDYDYDCILLDIMLPVIKHRIYRYQIKVRSKTQAILTALYYWLGRIIPRLLLPILMSV